MVVRFPKSVLDFVFSVIPVSQNSRSYAQTAVARAANQFLKRLDIAVLGLSDEFLFGPGSSMRIPQRAGPLRTLSYYTRKHICGFRSGNHVPVG